jgi:hypothetical protein
MSVLVIGGSIDNILIVKKLKLAGFRVVLIDRNPFCVARQYCDVFEEISTFDYEPQMALLQRYSVFYCVTRSTGIAAKNCYRLNEILFFGQASSLADTILNKGKLSLFCADNEILYPRTQIACKDSQKTRFQRPFVIKPIYEKIGKVTTFKVSVSEDFNDFIDRSNINSYVHQSIIQEYIDGDDYSLIGYVHNQKYVNFGLFYEKNTILEGKVKHDGFFLDHVLGLEPFMEIASKIAKMIYIPLCPLNIGFRVSEGCVVLLECNLDFGGERVIEDLLSTCELDLLGNFFAELKNLEMR